MKIKSEDGQQTDHATGQGAFPLTPTSDVQFEFTRARVVNGQNTLAAKGNPNNERFQEPQVATHTIESLKR